MSIWVTAMPCLLAAMWVMYKKLYFTNISFATPEAIPREVASRRVAALVVGLA